MPTSNGSLASAIQQDT